MKLLASRLKPFWNANINPGDLGFEDIKLLNKREDVPFDGKHIALREIIHNRGGEEIHPRIDIIPF